jgi:hypothetical protein
VFVSWSETVIEILDPSCDCIFPRFSQG